MNIFKEMFLANLKELIRDRAGLFWLLAFPVIFVFIFGIIFSGGQQQSFNVGIVSQSQTPMVEQMIEGIKNVSSFNINVETENEEKEIDKLEKGQRSLVIILPEINYDDIAQQKSFEIPVYYDNTQQNTKQVLISVINQVFSQMERKVTQRPQVFEIAQKPVQARKLSNFDYVLPGILAMAIMQLGLFGSFQFLSLREQKIIRGLGVTPLPRFTLLSSEIVVRLILSLVQTMLVLIIGTAIFDVTIIGNIIKLAGLVILGALTFISMGYMLISFASSTESAEGLIQVVQFPMMFLSGIFFPISIMPDFIKPVVKAIPLTYLGDALRQVMVGAPSDHAIGTNILVLAGWLGATLIVTVKFWRWE
ncbi:MAG: ABC transporter permease [Bacillota bacterium]